MLVHIKMCLINYRRCLSRPPSILKAQKYKILSFLPPIKQTLTKLTLYCKQLETFLNLLFFLKSARFKRGIKGRKCDFKNSSKKVQLSSGVPCILYQWKALSASGFMFGSVLWIQECTQCHTLSTRELLSHQLQCCRAQQSVSNSYMSITEKYLPWHFLQCHIIMNCLKN